MSGKKRLSRHDDRPGYALSLWHLWQRVPATEEVDGEDVSLIERMWSYDVHQIARESYRPEGIPDLDSPLGPMDTGGQPGPQPE